MISSETYIYYSYFPFISLLKIQKAPEPFILRHSGVFKLCGRWVLDYVFVISLFLAGTAYNSHFRRGCALNLLVHIVHNFPFISLFISLF